MAERSRIRVGSSARRATAAASWCACSSAIRWCESSGCRRAADRDEPIGGEPSAPGRHGPADRRRAARPTSTPSSWPCPTARRRRWCPDLARRGLTVIDLGPDFRLRDPADYPRWYGFEHPRAGPAGEGGLRPARAAPRRARGSCATPTSRIVGSPGCYSTAAILALAPLARAGLIDDVVVDAKSGVSGAGREAKPDMQFSEVNESVKAYGVGGHRHVAEIEQELGVLARRPDRAGRLPAPPDPDDARHPGRVPRPPDAAGRRRPSSTRCTPRRTPASGSSRSSLRRRRPSTSPAATAFRVYVRWRRADRPRARASASSTTWSRAPPARRSRRSTSCSGCPRTAGSSSCRWRRDRCDFGPLPSPICRDVEEAPRDAGRVPAGRRRAPGSRRRAGPTSACSWRRRPGRGGGDVHHEPAAGGAGSAEPAQPRRERRARRRGDRVDQRLRQRGDGRRRRARPGRPGRRPRAARRRRRRRRPGDVDGADRHAAAGRAAARAARAAGRDGLAADDEALAALAEQICTTDTRAKAATVRAWRPVDRSTRHRQGRRA